MRTQQILINLLSNALKFSKPHDTVTVELCPANEVSQGKTNFDIKITGQGPGLNESDRANLFKPYFKSSCEQTRALNAHSNGLGLSICKKIAQLLDSDLHLAEDYQGGC